jgi:hypothetical protein
VRNKLILSFASAAVLLAAWPSAASSSADRAAPALRSATVEQSGPGSPTPSRRLAAFTAPVDFFPILPWDPFHGWKEPFLNGRKLGFESIADCHFTVAGFVWAQDLPACERLGLAAIVVLDAVFVSPKELAALSATEIDARIKGAVERTAASPAVIGYFITDEPGASHFPALAAAVRAVKRHAPGKLAYINLFPDYATTGETGKSQLETPTYTEHLERFVREVGPQFLSYDNYQVEYSDDLRKPVETASYFRNLLEIRRVALANDLPFWNIVTCNQIRPATTIPSPSNLLLQAYTTLAAGGRGLSWYTYYSQGYKYAPIDENGNRTMTWHYLQEVNRQVSVLGPTMNRLQSIGVFFSMPLPAPGLPPLPGRVIAEVESAAPLMVGEFTGSDGADFAMLVNLSLERSTEFKIKAASPVRRADVVSAEDGALLPMGPEISGWLVAGQGVLLRFRKE